MFINCLYRFSTIILYKLQYIGFGLSLVGYVPLVGLYVVLYSLPQFMLPISESKHFLGKEGRSLLAMSSNV